MGGSVSDANPFIRCAEFSQQQFAEATEVARNAKKCVLDISACVTITWLNAWDKIDRDWEYYVSQSTLDTVSEWLHEKRTDGQRSGHTALMDDGKSHSSRSRRWKCKETRRTPNYGDRTRCVFGKKLDRTGTA